MTPKQESSCPAKIETGNASEAYQADLAEAISKQQDEKHKALIGKR